MSKEEKLVLDKEDLRQWSEIAFELAGSARAHFMNVFSKEERENDPIVSYLYKTILSDQTYLYDDPKELMWRIGRLSLLNKMAEGMRK